MRKVYSLSSPEFNELFTSYKSSAFRLETLQSYAVSYEDKSFQDFLQGEPKYTDAPHKEWVKLIESSIQSGKTMSRVHIVEEPLTDYLRFEILWPYCDNVNAGDDIGLIPTTAGQWPLNLPKEDFWLFDDNLVAEMKYDSKHGFVEAVITDDQDTVKKCVKWKEIAKKNSIHYNHYIKRM